LSESEEHKSLKGLGRVLLKDMGFKPSEIQEEYRLEVNTLGERKKYYIVDLCGIAKRRQFTKAVAVECGNTDGEKLTNLNLYFDEVIHLPYGVVSIDLTVKELIEQYETQLDEYRMQIEALEKEINNLNSKLSWEKHNMRDYQQIKLLNSVIADILGMSKLFIDSGDQERIRQIRELVESFYVQKDIQFP